MAQVDTRAPGDSRAADTLKRPTVLVVLVVRDAAAWLAQCLVSLSKQTHPRIGVLAVDNASTDGSADLLESALGPDRVTRLGRNAGFAGAVALALRSAMAEAADYVLLLHDDTMLAPEAVAGMVDAAERIDGVGVVGPKILDWTEAQVLREIGQSTDRFGFAYSPLEEGEIDHGQYDRIREVLFVSSAAMLVSRAAWTRIGAPDERFSLPQEDVDYCWRARVAGFRVVMTPRAVARHRGAWATGERPNTEPVRRGVFERERAALGTMIKNYRLLSLSWILPLYFMAALGRILVLSVGRRFEDVYQILAAWGWNAGHLPGTWVRRRRAQSVRAVPDRSVRRSMAPAGVRLRRWASFMGRTLLPAPGDAEQPVVPFRLRAIRFAVDHTAATASALGLLVALVAYRNLLTAAPLVGPALGGPPPSAAAFFRELVSGLRSTGLGGSQAASPALGLLGLGSVATFGSPALLQKVMVLGLPVLAAAVCYRAVRSITGERVPSVVAAAAYAVSSLVLWGVSEGRVEALVFVAGLPWVAAKLWLAFDPQRPVSAGRWVVGTALGLAVLGSFYPGTLLGAGVLAAVGVLIPTVRAERLRGALLIAAALVVGGALVVPFALELLRAGWSSLGDPAGHPAFGALIRLSPGAGPGSWASGYYLPAAALLSLLFVPKELSGPAARAAFAAVASVYLAWLSAAGYLPAALSNPVAYLAVSAFGYVLLIALGLRSLIRGVSTVSFGGRQIGAAAITLMLGAGLLGQALQAASGSWALGSSERIPEAYPVVGSEAVPPYRILWLGLPGGDPFPPPGGPPDGTVAAGDASVRFGLRSPRGESQLDVGRPIRGPGYDYLERALQELLAGEVRHGGAMLAPLGIRYLVASEGDLSQVAVRRLSRQLDLDEISAGGLIVFRNTKAPPVAATVSDPAWVEAARGDGPAAAVALPEPHAVPLEPHGPTVRGPAPAGPSVALLGQQFDPRWRLHAGGGGPIVAPERAFGWEVGFAVPSGTGTFRADFGGQGTRTAQTVVMTLLWIATLWVTRRKGSRA